MNEYKIYLETRQRTTPKPIRNTSVAAKHEFGLLELKDKGLLRGKFETDYLSRL